jgi:hypothetical protein
VGVILTPIPELKAILKSCVREVQLYVAALERENLKLHLQVAKLQADNMSANHRALAHKKELEKKVKRGPPSDININFVTPGDRRD